MRAVRPSPRQGSSTRSVRAAATVPATSRGYDGGKKVPGRKRHIVTDTLGLLLVVAVTAANLKLAKPLHAEASHPRSDREVESPFPKAAPPSGEVKVPSLGSHTAIIPLRCALTGDARRCEAAKLAYFVSFGWLVCTCSRKTVRSWT